MQLRAGGWTGSKGSCQRGNCWLGWPLGRRMAVTNNRFFGRWGAVGVGGVGGAHCSVQGAAPQVENPSFPGRMPHVKTVSKSSTCYVFYEVDLLLHECALLRSTSLSPSPSFSPLDSTGLYVKRPQVTQRTVSGGGRSSDVSPPLELSKTTDADDVFTIHIPKSKDLEDVHYVLKYVEALTVCLEEFRGVQSPWRYFYLRGPSLVPPLPLAGSLLLVL